MTLDAHHYVKAKVSSGKYWRGPKAYWNPSEREGQLPIIRPKQADGSPASDTPGYIIYRFMVNIDQVGQVNSRQAFIDNLYDDPPPPVNALQFSVGEVLNQTGFEKVKRMYTAMWNQYQKIQPDIQESDIRNQLEEGREKDTETLRESAL
jgi:hypothetical protein